MSKKDKKISNHKEIGQDNHKSLEPNPHLTNKTNKFGYIKIILFILICYSLCMGLRLLEVPKWQNPSFQINNEKLMATHDAYFGMANAKGTGRSPDQSLSEILSVTNSITGINLGILAFWFPAFLAPIAGLPLILLARKWNMLEAGLVAGVLSGSCLGFLMRTRVGFFDNDILILFFTIAFVSSLIIWTYPFIKSHWFFREQDDNQKEIVGLNSVLVYPIFLGILGWIYVWFRSAGNSFIIAFLGLAALLSIFFPANKQNRIYLLFSIVIIYSISLAGWVGLLISIILFCLFKFYPQFWKNKNYFYLIVGCLALFFLVFTDFHWLIIKNIDRIISYTKETSTKSGQLLLPSIKQSVREAQNIPFSQIISRISGHWSLFAAGILGYLYLIYKRPAAIILLPLLGVSLGAVKLGNRFTMYGGSIIGIGLAFGLSQLLLKFNTPKKYRWIVQIALLAAVLWPSYDVAKNLSPAPILPKVYAQTFLDLKKESPDDVRLWQWWDYGYAGQYYAERATFGDGGGRFHKGSFLYPMAKVHMTHDPLQANQLIKFTTLTQREEYKENATRYKNSPKIWRKYLPDPAARLREMGPEKAQSYVESLKSERKDWPDSLPNQYLVVSWENLRLAYWISYYGTWDLETGQASPGKIQQVQGQVKFNMQRGIIKLSRGQVRLNALDIIDRQDSRHLDWSNGSGIYAIMNNISNELYLMDSRIYKSLMVQMLIADPNKFNDNFELVVDHYPWNRAYRLK